MKKAPPMGAGRPDPRHGVDEGGMRSAKGTMWDVLRAPTARWGAVLWLATNGLGIAAGLWPTDPARDAWIGLHAVYAAHLVAALFFLLFLWPLVIPPAVRAEESATGRPAAHSVLAADVVLYAALAAPLAVLSARLAEVGLGDALRSGAVVVASAACVAAVFSGAGWSSPRVSILYQCAAWSVAAAAPFVYYLAREWADADWRGLAALSPFWGVAEPDAPTPWGPLWRAQAGGYGFLAALLLAARALAERRAGGRETTRGTGAAGSTPK